MKRSMFRLLTVSLSIVAIALCAGSVFAQGNGNGNGNGGGNGSGDPPPPPPFNYRVEYVDFHLGNNGSQGRPHDIAMVDSGAGESLYVVGKSGLVSGQRRAFVYDHQNNDFMDVPTLLGLDESVWVESSCKAISSTGIVAGALIDNNGDVYGFWFDLLAASPVLHLLEEAFPEIVEVESYSYAIDVNANGDILTANDWVVNIHDQTSQKLPSSFMWANAINDMGDVIGHGETGALRFNFHSPPGTIPEQINEVTGQEVDINNLGQFCGRAKIYYGKRNQFYNTHAYVWGDGPDFDWLSDPDLLGSWSNADSLNDSGDVVGQWNFFHYSANGETYRLTDLVDDPYLDTAGLGFMKVTERDTSLATPAPIIVGNAEGDSDEKIFILIPEDQP